MRFCPKCKSIMLPKKADNKVVMTCAACGNTDDKAEYTKIVEKSESAEKIEVVSDIEESMLPTTKEECETCGHDEAFYWLVQTRAADESATKFLRCTKCKHTWRDYS